MNYFVRHCETDWNRESRFQGQTDVPLNDLGRNQAVEMAALLQTINPGSNLPLKSIITSPLSRAHETAELMADRLNIPAQNISLDPRLSELSFGIWEGMTSQEIKDQHYDDRKARKAHRWTFAPPKGESSQSRIPQITAFLQQLPPATLVVTHSGIIRIIVYILAGLDAKTAADLVVPHGAVLIPEAGGVREYAKKSHRLIKS